MLIAQVLLGDGPFAVISSWPRGQKVPIAA
jgi:hypothetical protein